MANQKETERLYNLLPAVYRIRDAERGYPLRALLRVVEEQVDVVMNDIGQLYDNWFIETAEDWVVPYIGDLIGYATSFGTGDSAATMQLALQQYKVLIPRQEVGNTIRYRRRKGTLALLENLARDGAGWPSRAIEFYRLLCWTQNINHLYLKRGGTVDLRLGNALTLVDGPFDTIAHTVDVRRINSGHTRGRYNIPSVGLFGWRLQPYSVSRTLLDVEEDPPVGLTPAYCLEEEGPNCYEFSILGNDTQLFNRPAPENDDFQIAEEINLPSPIRRRVFETGMEKGRPSASEDYYGTGKSLAIFVEWDLGKKFELIPATAIMPADLSGWKYAPDWSPKGESRYVVAVDPELGRFIFPTNHLPKRVRVMYHYGFSGDIGGGEYNRPVSQWKESIVYRVKGDGELVEGREFRTIDEAVERWKEEKEQSAIIEIADSGVYILQKAIEVRAGYSLQLRGANRIRPIIRLLDLQADAPDSLTFYMEKGSRLTLDGLLITGRAVHIERFDPVNETESSEKKPPICDRIGVLVRHCTLVPGWGLHCDCEPRRPDKPTLELYDLEGIVAIEHSIIGPIQVRQDEVRTDPVQIRLRDSIVDATSSEVQAICAVGGGSAHAVLDVRRCTVYGTMEVHAITLAENSIFNDCLHVVRRQLGCMRFCYVPQGCRTPKRHNCQPDLVQAIVKEDVQRGRIPTAMSDEAKANEALRVRPQFTDRRYGRAGYAQLADSCADEIKRGADDESEMGVFHDLYQPQREDHLWARLNEYTPAGTNVEIILAT